MLSDARPAQEMRHLPKDMPHLLQELRYILREMRHMLREMDAHLLWRMRISQYDVGYLRSGFEYFLNGFA